MRKVAGTTALTVLGLIVIVLSSAWLRTPGFTQGGFASHDVAGILYNAMVLDRGGLPYVDTLELKAPGTFYLATWFAGPEARDIARFQIAANLWALLGLVLVAGLGWRLWGKLGALASAGLYALHDAHLDSMDANYVTWANAPQIAAFWLGIEAGRARSDRWRPTLWMLAGALASFAALCKRPDAVVLLALLVMAGVCSSARTRGWARAVDPGCVLAGFVLGHTPITLQYLAAGQLGALVDGYFLNRWGLRYVGASELGLGPSLREGALASAHFLGLAVVLASFPLFAALGRRVGAWRRAAALQESEARQLRELGFVLAWLLGTLIAASLGFRFYKGYFVAVAAPLCLLAAAPIGLLGRRCPAHWAPRALVLALCSVLVGRELLILDHTRADRAKPHDLGGRRIAAHLLANTQADDTIWIWGWHLWDVYPLAGRMSASTIYKSLGILSQPNDDTWRRPATRLRFVESEYSAQLIRELDAARPAYVVLGSTVPHRDFDELKSFLRRDYRRDYRVRIGRVQFWRRR
ncbi:hypothetical protein ENSA5_34810 [Enhygromyxa salina]|uniref:Glycosyltransferase RgtA/B/C/D-like domain-containing protein n=1 Tax=Enhygromyxa salina TaxID=215803 RepID=A0A2S9XW58_9BACT|nr:hypothetical protein [Enhygromyxa salina]PRP97098.1 hypothetical protein ENSA5_34810 [Enhygromyxa salina]